MGRAETINGAPEPIRPARLRWHRERWLASSVGVKRVVGLIQGAPQPALDGPEQPAKVASTRCKLHQFVTIACISEKLRVARPVFSVIAERLTAGERFTGAGANHITATSLDALDVPCTELPRGIKQLGIHGLETVPRRIKQESRAGNRSRWDVDTGQDKWCRALETVPVKYCDERRIHLRGRRDRDGEKWQTYAPYVLMKHIEKVYKATRETCCRAS
ncbi:hypothetical protein SAMN05446935_7701 [Burkholderia sp. YR290]|nr:hypothetical protein SAMN05446935_7701 [Burkholderia sp. YR290]